MSKLIPLCQNTYHCVETHTTVSKPIYLLNFEGKRNCCNGILLSLTGLFQWHKSVPVHRRNLHCSRALYPLPSLGSAPPLPFTGECPSPSLHWGECPSPSLHWGECPSPSLHWGECPFPSWGECPSPSLHWGGVPLPFPSLGGVPLPFPSLGSAPPLPFTGGSAPPLPFTRECPSPSLHWGGVPLPFPSLGGLPLPFPSWGECPSPSLHWGVPLPFLHGGSAHPLPIITRAREYTCTCISLMPRLSTRS